MRSGQKAGAPDKELPIGYDDFATVIHERLYYIDKTDFIALLLKSRVAACLITRPRCFGKSLNLSMLSYFFDIRTAEQNRSLFTDFSIAKSSYFAQQGQYPVLFVSFKGNSAFSQHDFLEQMREKLGLLYEGFSYLRPALNEAQQHYFDDMLFRRANKVQLMNSLLYLGNYLAEYWKKQVVFLIDEYDVPLIDAHGKDYYLLAQVFMKVLYGNAVKGNNKLRLAVMTGVIRTARAGIFSELNNLVEYSVLSKSYAECFGLTERETAKALADFGLSDREAEVSHWYDGYSFGGIKVYNPWSVLCFLKEGLLRPFWIDTSGNQLIKELLGRLNAKALGQMQALLQGESITVKVTRSVILEQNLTASQFFKAGQSV